MINKIFKTSYALAAIQFLTLGVFVFLIYGAIGITTQDADFAKVLRNTNLSNLMVWSYWWPIIIGSAIVFGRFWCTICPMELVTSFFGKLGLRKRPGKLLKSGWIITLLYAVILVLGIHTLAIHRIPQLMAIYMLILFALAVGVGLIWEKRTFCTYVCPIGHLLGLYALLSPKQLRVKNEEVCLNCKTKDCISKSSHYKFDARSCTSELYPPKITDNRDCILCGQCVKSCSKDNISIQKRKLALDVFNKVELKWAEIAFFIIVSGFVVYEILSEWKVSKGVLMSLPKSFNESLNITGPFAGTTKALLLFIVLPTLFFVLMAFLKKYFAQESWKSAMTQLVLTLLPVTASMHLLKALLKTTSRIPYWDYVFSDPFGMKTTELLLEQPDLIKRPVLDAFVSPSLTVAAFLLIILGLYISFRIILKQDHIKGRIVSSLAVISYSSLFLICLIYWRIM